MLARSTALIPDEAGSFERFLKSRGQAVFSPLLVFLLLQSLPFSGPGLKQSLFCRPSSVLSAVLLGAERSQDAAGYPVLTLSSVALRVGESCSGYDFFCLTAGVLLWILLRKGSLAGLRALMRAIGIALVASLLATLLANVSRICCVARLSPLAAVWIPDPWQGLFHYCLGVFVFLPYLLVLSLVFERISHVFRSLAR